jgi:Fe-S cluster assembly protein SufD
LQEQGEIMGVTLMKTPAELALAGQFARVSRWLPGATPIADMRQRAFSSVEAVGLPHKRTKGDAWHYTDLRQMLRQVPEPAVEPRDDIGVVAPFVPADGMATVTLINGWLHGTFGVPAGVELLRLADALTTGHPLLEHLGTAVDVSADPAASLNTAFMTDGVVIRVPAGAHVDQPLHLAFEEVMSSAAATAARVLVLVEAGASLTLVETHRGPGGIAYQTNTMVEVIAGEGASVEHARLNLAGDRAFTLSTLSVSLAHAASFNSFSLVDGAQTARHSIFVRVHGDDVKLGLNGAGLLGGQQHADTTLVVDHAALGGESRELFKTVVDGSATGVFQGKIIVRPGAQKTDGQMASNALLLSDDATMNNKPELEIFADDVQCAHGATIGSLDDTLLFYLMARGLPRAEAESLLIQAFVGEAVETVAHEGLREAITGRVAAWLRRRSHVDAGVGV